MDRCPAYPVLTLFWAEAGWVIGPVGLLTLSFPTKAAGISLAGRHSHPGSSEGPGRVPFALMIKGCSLQPALPASVSMAGRQNAQCEIDRKIPGVKLRVIDAITYFSCVPFCPHLISITATQNQEWGTSGARWNYRDREHGP